MPNFLHKIIGIQILILLSSGLQLNAQIENPLVIKTQYGYVKGEKDRNNTLVWRGIPYAKPPVGNLRWKPPVNPDPWEGVLKTKKFGNPPLQYHAAFKNKIFGNEDCLYLNIWKPEGNKEKLPVYVWIHGGGNTIGYSNQLYEYYGHEIASRSEVIYVSINYRLGPFGWLSHPALHNSDNVAENSGNYGTLDIIHALKWIQDNIEAFGGDPKKVLISGESAGGINILSLMISPPAKGLFSAALCESGIPKTGSIEESKNLAEDIIKQLLIENKFVKNEADAEQKLRSMNDEEIRNFLYAQEGKDIMKCLSPYLLGMINMPFIFPDGYVIPKEGYDVLNTGKKINKVPLIIGCNSNEMKLFVYFSKEPNWKDSMFTTATKYSSEMWKAVGVDDIARKLNKSDKQAPVYVYLFNYGNPDSGGNSPLKRKWGEKLGAHHMSEIKFFLGTDKRRTALLSFLNRNSYKNGRDSLSAAMMLYAKNLLYFEDPNYQSNAVYWPKYSKSNETKGLLFDVDKDNARIEELKYELYKDSILIDMKKNLSKKQIKIVNDFLFIFE